MRLPVLLLTATALAAAGCTWVPMAPEASAVRVIPMGAAPAGCEMQQEIEVKVTGKVGFYERNTLRVREELETLARNEAAELKADALQPLEEPRGDEQRFAAYRCTR
jgi:hypothetical protein